MPLHIHNYFSLTISEIHPVAEVLNNLGMGNNQCVVSIKPCICQKFILPKVCYYSVFLPTNTVLTQQYWIYVLVVFSCLLKRQLPYWISITHNWCMNSVWGDYWRIHPSPKTINDNYMTGFSRVTTTSTEKNFCCRSQFLMSFSFLFNCRRNSIWFLLTFSDSK